MIRLDLKSGPFWLDIGGGVALHLKPATTALMIEARRDPDLVALGDDVEDEQVGFVFARAVARRAVIDWRGVVDGDGKKVAVTREMIDALLDHFRVFESFQDQYLVPAIEVDQEKNGSPSSPSGHTAGAKNTAKPARKSARSARKK